MLSCFSNELYKRKKKGKYDDFSGLKELLGLMEMHMEKVGDIEIIKCNVNNSESCRCNELEERSEKAEAKCAELELELQKKNKYCEELEAKLNLLKNGKFAMDDKLKFLSSSSEALKTNQFSSEREKKKKKDVDLEEEDEGEDKVSQLTVEMRVLEIEKIKAESEAQVWKERFKRLESKALESGLKLANFHEGNGVQDSVLVKPEEFSHPGTSLNFLQKQGKVMNMDDVASCNSLSAGTTSTEICWGYLLHDKAPLYRRARKHLALESEQSPCNKMVPCTPRGQKPSTNAVYIIDSDDEPNITQQPMLDNQDSGNISFSTCVATEEEKLSDKSLKASSYGGNNEDLNFGTDLQFTARPKRKRTQNVVTSESESDDDKLPISKLRRMISADQVRCNLNELVIATSPVDDQVTDTVTPRRRLVPLRKCVIKSQQDKKSLCGPSEDKHEQIIPTNGETDDDELEEVSSDSEEGSLSNFIVHDSDVSDQEDASCDGKAESHSQDVSDGQVDRKSSCRPSEDKHEQGILANKEIDDNKSDEVSPASGEGSLGSFIVHDLDASEDASDGDVDSDSRDVSDGDLNLNEILSQIQRNKDQKRKWEFEADMLAAFGKDPQICMKAVCTLYRQQTSEERTIKGSLHYNGRGFSNVDAFRGSTLAEFLTDGDPLGDVKKSVKELKEYDPKGIEICRTMALRYSKQLFEIYKNKEDPFFP